MRYLIFILVLFATSCNTDVKLQSGPMVGYSELTEVQVWVQSKFNANMSIRYWKKGSPDSSWTSASIKTTEKGGFTAKLRAENLDPGTEYKFIVLQNGREVELDYNCKFTTQELWHYRKDPEAFRLALGSCVYVNEEEFDRPGKGYGGDYQVFESIRSSNPDLMLWLGDNTYYREADAFTWNGLLHRNTHTRSLKEMQPLLASTNNYAIWDDHDFGLNDAVGTWIYKDKAKEAFKLFWANPSFGNSELEGITSNFYFNDVQFYLLDNRWFRTPKYDSSRRKMLGKTQMEWLISELKASKSQYKFIAVGGQMLSSAMVYENFSNFPEERNYLLRRLSEENISGVVFLTGDRHHSEFSVLELANGEKVYDFTVSPLTSSVSNVADKEQNAHRLEGSLIQSRGFGLIDVSGPFGKRSLNFQLLDSDGQKLWEQSISPTEDN